MADNMGYDSSFNMEIEDSYGGAVAGGSPSEEFPIVEGGDNLKRTVDQTPRRSVSARGVHDIVPVRAAAAGSLDFDFDYDQLGRLFFMTLGAGEKVTDGSSPFDSYYTVDDSLPSAKIIVRRDQLEYTYAGSKINTLTIGQSGGDIMTVTPEFLSKSEAIAAAAIGQTWPTFAPLKQEHLAYFYIGAVDIADLVRSFEVVVNNNLDGDHWPLGVTGRGEPKRRGSIEVTGTIEMEWDDNFMKSDETGFLQDWIDNTSRLVEIEFNNGLSTTNEKEFLIHCPAVKISEPDYSVNTSGVQVVTFGFTALDATMAANTLDGTSGGLSGGNHAAVTNCPIGFRVSGAEDFATFTT
jgi:hypothetical protein